MVKTKESGPSGDSDELCPELSSGSMHSYMRPPRCCPPLPEWLLSEPLFLSEPLSRCGQRPHLSGSHLRGGVRGSISICLVHPINSMLAPPPGSLVQGDHLHDVSLLPPMFLIFFFNLCGLCNCSLLYTLVLKGYTGRLSRSLSLSLSFQKLPRSHLPSQFAFVGFQLLGFYYCLFL